MNKYESKCDYRKAIKRYKKQYIKDIEYFNIILPNKIREQQKKEGFKTIGLRWITDE